MDSQMKNNLTNADGWIRGLYVLLFLFCLHLASMLMVLIALVQIVFNLVTGEPNQWLRHFGVTLADYINSANVFVCHQSNEKPFPFADWPKLRPLVIADEAETVVDLAAVDKVEVTDVLNESESEPQATSNLAVDCNADDSHLSDKK
jgi:hypothetical protein